MVNTRLDDAFPLQDPLDPRDYGRARLFNVAVRSPSTSTSNGSNRSSDSSDDQKQGYRATKTNTATTNVKDGIYKIFCHWHADNPFVRDSWYKSVSDNMNDYYYDEDYESDDQNEDNNSRHGSELMPAEESLWASRVEIKHAIRKAFDKCANHSDDDDDVIIQLQRVAMNAIQNILQQERMQQQSSCSIDMHHGLRVIATSSCIGMSSSSSSSSSTDPHDANNSVTKYRFAYRIRVENLLNSTTAVQLLGRTWHIQDMDIDSTSGNTRPVGAPQHVHAPTTGAVGHLPVLQAGDVFEYMSGCELFTKRGTMSGCFHMAVVPENTKSALVGDPTVLALLQQQRQAPQVQNSNKDYSDRDSDAFFELPIAEFPLVAP